MLNWEQLVLDVERFLNESGFPLQQEVSALPIMVSTFAPTNRGLLNRSTTNRSRRSSDTPWWTCTPHSTW